MGLHEKGLIKIANYGTSRKGGDERRTAILFSPHLCSGGNFLIEAENVA
jgi:hypothetical protein